MNAFSILPENYFLLNDSIIVRTICAALPENFFLTLAGAYANKSKVVCFEKWIWL